MPQQKKHEAEAWRCSKCCWRGGPAASGRSGSAGGSHGMAGGMYPHCPLPQSSPGVLGATKAGTPLRPGLAHARSLTGGPERNCSVPGALGGGFVSAASNELPTSPSIRASGWGRWRDPSCQSPSHYISLGGARGFLLFSRLIVPSDSSLLEEISPCTGILQMCNAK